ncbi:hypothetical protein [Flavimarina sp. Hel_I_48]|uniref:hypothetical protein n=1 Tax=Flavimarina sp. Hel_I_48 TaxID=1392488 RepID=UPI00068E3DCB|nr:hypothetical protein [Flavimarina sp. Hel_I_48]
MQTKQQKKYSKVKLKSLLTGSLIAAFLVASPYLYYLYEGFPNVKIWKASFLGLEFTYDSKYYESVYVVAWTLVSKVFPLIFMMIWFFTCKHWWYHAILIPILMFGIQIYLTLNDDLKWMDSNEFYILAPIIFIMLIFSYGIRMQIFDKIHNIDYSELKRVTLKGDIKEENKKDYPFEASYSSFSAQEEEENYEDDDDNEPLYMG